MTRYVRRAPSVDDPIPASHAAMSKPTGVIRSRVAGMRLASPAFSTDGASLFCCAADSTLLYRIELPPVGTIEGPWDVVIGDGDASVDVAELSRRRGSNVLGVRIGLVRVDPVREVVLVTLDHLLPHNAEDEDYNDEEGPPTAWVTTGVAELGFELDRERRFYPVSQISDTVVVDLAPTGADGVPFYLLVVRGGRRLELAYCMAGERLARPVVLRGGGAAGLRGWRSLVFDIARREIVLGGRLGLRRFARVGGYDAVESTVSNENAGSVAALAVATDGLLFVLPSGGLSEVKVFDRALEQLVQLSQFWLRTRTVAPTNALAYSDRRRALAVVSRDGAIEVVDVPEHMGDVHERAQPPLTTVSEERTARHRVLAAVMVAAAVGGVVAASVDVWESIAGLM